MYVCLYVCVSVCMCVCMYVYLSNDNIMNMSHASAAISFFSL